MQNEIINEGAAALSINRLSSLTSTQRHQNPNYVTIQAAESSTEFLNEVVEEKKPKTKEELLAERALKRADKKLAIREKAEGFKRAGDVLCSSKNYKAAYPQYLEAIQLLGNVPDYYISLAAVYRKLTWYEEAAHAATRALTVDPHNLEARYVRGVSRLEQRLLKPAKTDFEIVLEHDSSHLLARTALGEVNQFVNQEGADTAEEVQMIDFGFPHWDYEALEVASVSDSSDCQHVGNGVPCRFYNHEGCSRGSECAYSHAPDEKSVRDDLGKNVCIYHLLDSCKFGRSKCVYSHNKDALPKRGWWNSPEKTAKVKAVLDVAETNARVARQHEALKWKAQVKEMRTWPKPPKSAGVNGKAMSPKKVSKDDPTQEVGATNGGLDEKPKEATIVEAEDETKAKPSPKTSEGAAPKKKTTRRYFGKKST
ncbi:hypothetical protein CPB83DRAFT_844632 [Crepidotus variabilis]|uniref:C3H1-type domain-containing protein n=1 Tax=Crepidotus variabilis TaxID=179855 RepID=A0A9P6JVD0_9AGAR|nr:hypothetical protein CPB83DRAFT_844632 [Crepidotus variabilis]